MKIRIETNQENSTNIVIFTREDDSSIFFEFYIDEENDLSLNAVAQLRDFLDEYIEENTDGYDDDEIEEGTLQ